MELSEKVRAVEEVFQKLDQEIASFQLTSGLHCKWGCGKCCYKADLEATVLEFLPFAFHIYQKDLAFEWLEKLKINTDPICMILNATQEGAGLCSAYSHRGLICRLFGYSARVNKYGQRELITCNIIKTEQAERVRVVSDALTTNAQPIPIMTNYYMQLHAIDADLAREFFPINKALKQSIELILHYYAYRS